MGILFAGDLNAPPVSGTGFVSQSVVPSVVSKFISSGTPSANDATGFCDTERSAFLGDRFTSGSATPFLGNRFSSPQTPPQPPPMFLETQFQTYAGPIGSQSSSTLRNDFFSYDKLHQEYIARGSSRIIVYRLDRARTQIDGLTGEPYGNEFFKKGIVIQGKYQLNPIIQELSRFGISEDEDIIFEANYTHLMERLGRPILKGDLMVVYLTSQRLTPRMLELDQKNQDYYVRQTRKIFRIITSVPKDVFLFNYLTIECNAKKTNLSTERVETGSWDDVYEIPDTDPDVINEDANPVPLNL